MEGERRKRKLENEDEEEEEEEQKMEKFFALIKSTKGVRDLLSKKVDDEKAKGIWTPTFQPEDFIGYGEFGKSNISTPDPHAAASSEKEKQVIIENDYLQEATKAAVVPTAKADEDKEKASHHLDLNLSL